jgi:hypothetical protein
LATPGREKAKEAEELRASVTEKVASLVSVEEQLRQERAARQHAEDQVQQERAALVEARAALEQEHLAWEEAQGQLQQERTALEGALATLKQRDDDVSRLNGELVQLSISHEDLRQSLEEQEATVRDLRREAEEARKALDLERKQVEGEFHFRPFSFVDLSCSGSAPRRIRPPRPRLCTRATTPHNRIWRSCGLPHSRSARRLKKARRGLGARWRVAYAPSAGMSPSACAAPFIWASRRPLAWWHPTTRSTSRPYPRATSSQSVEDEVAMDRVDALTATATDMLAEDFTDFLFPDAPAAGGPQA